MTQWITTSILFGLCLQYSQCFDLPGMWVLNFIFK